MGHTANDADLVAVSKRLSYVLRHRPDSVGVTLDRHGWVDVEALLAALSRTGQSIDRDILALVVDTSDKQRFEWDLEADRIRARQGHSVPVDLQLDFAEPPAVLFHGTPERNVASILGTGLDRRRRHHVHLSPDADTAHRVGARRGHHVVLRVDAAAMRAQGFAFWVTGNGVWLTDAVPPQFLTLPDGTPPD